MNYPTSNILNRIVRVRAHENGTGLIIDHEDVQYLLTAAHVVDGIHRGQGLSIDTRVASLNVTVIRKESLSDVSLLRLDKHVPDCWPITFEGPMTYGEDLYLAGFPAGQGVPVGVNVGTVQQRQTHLSPYLRKGCISNLERDFFYVDSLIQKGFSGGPAFIVRDYHAPVQILGIIKGGIVFPGDGSVADATNVTIRSGFTICHSIRIANELLQIIAR